MFSSHMLYNTIIQKKNIIIKRVTVTIVVIVIDTLIDIIWKKKKKLKIDDNRYKIILTFNEN